MHYKAMTHLDGHLAPERARLEKLLSRRRHCHEWQVAESDDLSKQADEASPCRYFPTL